MKTQRPLFPCLGVAPLGSRLLTTLLAVLNLLLVGQVTAQRFTTLYSFTASSVSPSGAYTNADGANPYAGLIPSGDGNTRYGTSATGGTLGFGTVFAVNADGSGFTNLHSFTWNDGANPWAGLLLVGDTLYGTTISGGSSGDGTVFAIHTDGTGFTSLHSFSDGNGGAYPNGGLIVLSNTLYGTASHGGQNGNGTVFSLRTDGTDFTNLYSFSAAYYNTFGNNPINYDGAVPVVGLVLSGSTLYGTTTGGGSGGNGTVFALNINGSGFVTLHSFEQTWQLLPGTGGPGIGGPGSQCIGGACTCMGFCSGGGGGGGGG